MGMASKNTATLAARSFSLNLLRTFDAAARLNSFKLAAAELCMTPSAVSQQIKELERYLGVQVFDRHSQGLKLNSIGQEYWKEISPALISITRSTQKIALKYTQQVLRISLIPPVAHRIIFPNLISFQKAYPEIDLVLDISETSVDLLRSSFDLAIRYGEPPWIGCEHQKLLDINVVPVCASIVDKEFLLRDNPENIINAPLIHMTNTPSVWADYLRALGMDAGKIRADIHVNDYQTAIDMVRSYGVTLALYPLEKAYIASQNLVVLDKLSVTYGAIYAVSAQGRLQEPMIQIFLQWLQEQLLNAC